MGNELMPSGKKWHPFIYVNPFFTVVIQFIISMLDCEMIT